MHCVFPEILTKRIAANASESANRVLAANKPGLISLGATNQSQLGTFMLLSGSRTGTFTRV
jgi:hypothetical protein